MGDTTISSSLSLPLCWNLGFLSNFHFLSSLLSDLEGRREGNTPIIEQQLERKQIQSFHDCGLNRVDFFYPFNPNCQIDTNLGS